MFLTFSPFVERRCFHVIVGTKGSSVSSACPSLGDRGHAVYEEKQDDFLESTLVLQNHAALDDGFHMIHAEVIGQESVVGNIIQHDIGLLSDFDTADGIREL